MGPDTAQAPTATAFPTHAPNATQAPEPTISSAGPGSPRPCTARAGGARVGDVAITKPAVLYAFNADYKLPDGLPADKPLVMTLNNNEPTLNGAAIEAGAVIQGSFLITICNTSSARAHTITALGVMLDSLTPYSGSLNAINGCAYLYSRPNGTGGECASGYEPDMEIGFQLSGAAAVGATNTQPATPAVKLAPGYGLDIAFDIPAPSSPAIAVYRLGVGLDGAAVVYPSGLRTPPRLDAKIVRHWSGTSCATAQMQAQIPATIPASTYYACPQ